MCLYGAKDLPYLARPFLNRERSKAYLKAVEQGHERGWTGDDDAILALDQVREARTPERFSVETLGGQEHDSKICGLRRAQVFLGNVAGIRLDPGFKLAGEEPDLLGILIVDRREQFLVILLGKLGIDR